MVKAEKKKVLCREQKQWGSNYLAISCEELLYKGKKIPHNQTYSLHIVNQGHFHHVGIPCVNTHCSNNKLGIHKSVSEDKWYPCAPDGAWCHCT